jgi:hypothetical protein
MCHQPTSIIKPFIDDLDDCDINGTQLFGQGKLPHELKAST